MAWYIGMIAVVVLNIILFISIVTRSYKIVEHLKEKERDYTYWMFRFTGLYLLYALYSAIFPTQYISYFVWNETPVSSIFVAWIFNTVGQLTAALLFFFAVNFNIEQAYDEDVRDRPADVTYPQCARLITWVYLILVIVAAVFAFWGMVSQDWSKFLIMTFLRLAGSVFALSVALKLYCTAKMLREKAGITGCVECNTWSAEPMAFVFVIYYLVSIIWYCAADIPQTYDHLNYQNMAMVPTLEFGVGFNEALTQQQQARSSSVWPPFVLGSYFVSIAVGTTLAVFMAAAPRLGTYTKTHDMVNLMPDFTHYHSERENCNVCSIQ